MVAAQSGRPQIVRMLPDGPRALSAGDVLQLHCVYNSSLVGTHTGFGGDATKGEMCNQYLFASSALTLSCRNEAAPGRRNGCAPSPTQNSDGSSRATKTAS